MSALKRKSFIGPLHKDLYSVYNALSKVDCNSRAEVLDPCFISYRVLVYEALLLVEDAIHSYESHYPSYLESISSDDKVL